MASHSAMHRGLAWLLAPITVDDFLGTWRGKQPFVVNRRQPDYFTALPSLADVDSLITTTVYIGRGQAGRLVRTTEDGTFTQRPFKLAAGNQPDIHDVYRGYDDGFTVVLNGLEGRSAAVGGLCQQLEAALQHRVGANLYLTPPRAQGARPHVDSHDVMLAQLHGTKRWQVAKQPTSAEHSSTEPRESIELGETHTWMLAAGDMLYIPAGFAHAGVADESASLHLTFGVNVLTWADLLSEAIQIHAKQGDLLAQALPTGYLDAPIDSSSVERLLSQLDARTLGDALDSARLALGSRLLERQQVRSGHFSSLGRLGELTAQTEVERSFEGPLRLRWTEDTLTAEFPGNYVSVPLSLASALEYCARHRDFRVGDLMDCLSMEQSVGFVARMIRDGLLKFSKEV